MKTSKNLLLTILLCGTLAGAQEVSLTARVAWMNPSEGRTRRPMSGVVVWLSSANEMSQLYPVQATKALPRLIQKNKTFEPHVLVVPMGSLVEFPNHDPFFHNVFSLFEGKRFDLGLYEAGSSREVRFSKAGVSYIFCNIHPEMSAVVIAVTTPYYAISNDQGEVVIPKVPSGRYQLRIWYEGASPEDLDLLARPITVSERNSALGVVRLRLPANTQTHKNKYGREYDPPVSNSPGYQQP